jgi:hypothetical protein
MPVMLGNRRRPAADRSDRHPADRDAERRGSDRRRVVPLSSSSWRLVMSVLIRFSPPSLKAEQYDEVVRRLNEEGVFPADGLEFEICYGTDGSLRVSQVWDTREHLEAFGRRLQPILAEVGVDPGTPEILDVHNIIKD